MQIFHTPSPRELAIRLRARNRSRSGVALLVVMVSVALMAVLIVEIIFSSNVEINISRNARDRLQAYYLAQSATRYGVMRLNMFKELKGSPMAQNIEAAMGKGILEKIWSIPLPEFPLSDTPATADWPGTISATIKGESSKIPINLLDGANNTEFARWRGMGEDSDNKYQSVRKEIENLIKAKLDNDEDEEFERKYRGMEAKDLLDPLEDWIDPDPTRKEGGDELSDYDNQDPAYYPRNDRIPTLAELSMIKGWTPDWIEALSSSFSVLNNKIGLDANHVSLDRLKAIDPDLSPEDLRAIEAHRQLTPFGSLSDLINFIQTSQEIKNGRNFVPPSEWQEKAYDLTGGTESLFYVEGTGVVGEARRTMRVGLRLEAPPPPACQPNEAPDTCKKRQADYQKTNKKLDLRVITVEEVQ